MITDARLLLDHREIGCRNHRHAVLLGDLLSTPPDLHGYLPLLARAVEIASDMRCGFYDCLYVALAEREACELVTSDQKMVAHLQKQFPFIVPLSSLP